MLTSALHWRHRADQIAQRRESRRNPEHAVHIAQLTRRVASVAGADVRYQVTGQGEPVALVHGLSGSSRWWVRNIPALARYYTVYLVDLPGFGALRQFPQRLRFAELASWLLAWMDAVHLKRIRLVGHSMGGALAIQAAVQRPAAFEQLVLVAPATSPLGHTRLHSLLLPLAAALPSTSLSFLPILAYDALRAGPGALLHFSRDLLRADGRADLTRVSAPTLLIWGAQDTLVPPSLGPLMREALPHAELVTLSGVGHVVMYDRPKAFNAAALAFFASERAPSA